MRPRWVDALLIAGLVALWALLLWWATSRDCPSAAPIVRSVCSSVQKIGEA